ncbi:MAG TPA: hypothetical protein DDY20_03670 [Desulfobulbaceae bacterium]|nr:hypothetical protein [Desulfobulbaceae bacterium]
MGPERKLFCLGIALGLFLYLAAAPLTAVADTDLPLPRMQTVQLGESTSVRAWPLVIIGSDNHPAAGLQEKEAPSQIASMTAPYPANKEEVPTSPPAKQNPSTSDLFGPRGGYLHPFLGIREEYTDNVYNIDVDKVENFLTTVSTGAWLSAPRLKEVPASIAPHNAAVAGMRYSVPASGSFERFQTYLLGALDYKTYSTESDLDYTAWHLEGMYQQNLPAGISFRVRDRYTRDQDRFDIGSFQLQDFIVEPGGISVRSTPSQIRDYISNQAIFSTHLEFGERFSAMFNFINFFLDYEDDKDEWLDRTDNSLGLTLSYKYSPKTSFFIEYDRAVISYSADTPNDSQDSFFFGGINWQGSAKTSLIAKGGYQLKQYDIEDNEDSDTFTMEAQLNYLITDKTKIGFSLYRAMEETDSLRNRGMVSTAARLRYDQRISYRIQGGIELGFEENDYDGFDPTVPVFLPEEARLDTRYLVRPSLHYFFRDWLVGELSYTFEDRNSTDTYYDFTSNTFFFSINAAF